MLKTTIHGLPITPRARIEELAVARFWLDMEFERVMRAVRASEHANDNHQLDLFERRAA